MNDELKRVFDQVHAEDTLKEKTKEFISQKTKGYAKVKTVRYRRWLPVVACFLLVLFGGYRLYFTPIVEIAVDINPSIVLGVNQFDRVVTVSGYNDDGHELSKALDIKYMDYTEAINEILQNRIIAGLLSDNEILSIGVIGPDGEQSSKILSGIESCTIGERNAYCYYACTDEMQMAHEMGLPCGKYRAFLELRELDPRITVEEIRNMTIREIRSLIDSLSTGTGTEINTENNRGYGHHGAGNGHGHCQRNGWGYAADQSE